MLRILIADDHAVVRAGYREFLEADPSVTIVGEAASGREALKSLQQKEWDLLLLDINMPDQGGLDILQHVASHHPAVRVLVMSGLSEELYARNVIRAGAKGFVSKGSAPEEFLKAVSVVVRGGRYVSAALAESLAANLENRDDRDAALYATLSTREFQLLRKIAAGIPIGRIAKEMALSLKTVSNYRARLLKKMDLNSNAGITTYARRNGLL